MSAMQTTVNTTKSRPSGSLPPMGPPSRWSADQQIVGYRSREKIEPTRMIGCGPHPYLLPLTIHQISPRWLSKGRDMDLDQYMESARVSGTIVVRDGEVLLERYGLGRTARDRWESQSVTKSVTGLLLGAAIHDGYIESMDARITDYIAALKGSAYEDVTIRHLGTMTSGVKFDEDYGSPHGDGSRMWVAPFADGVNPTVAYMRGQPRIHQPGSKFFYSTGDTDLLAIVVSNAVGKSLSEYLSEKIWQPYGMERNAYWVVDPAGNERGGGGITMTLRDYARIGQFTLDGGKIGSTVQVLPSEWLAEATRAQVAFRPGSYSDDRLGYGYLWWIYKNAYAARGHAGQAIFVYPKGKVVIAINSVWLEPGTAEDTQAQAAFVAALYESATADS